MRGRGAGGGLDLGIAGTGAAEADVVARRGRKDHRVLRHQRDVLAEAVAAHPVKRHTVEQHPACIGVVEALDKLHDGGLARAGRANEGHRLARLNVEVDAVQRLDPRPRRIGEIDLVEGDLAAHGSRHRQGLNGIGHRVLDL